MHVYNFFVCVLVSRVEHRKPLVGRILTTGCLICEVQTICVAITLESLCDAVTTPTLKVARMTSPQLCNTKILQIKTHFFSQRV